MKILAIDTTAKTAAGAICKDGKTLSSFQITGGFTHSETMMPQIDILFKKTGLTADDIDMFAISEGPGSFTGVRIGAALIKGLAFGKNKPCVGVSSLEALCENSTVLSGDFIVCAVMDARRSQLYNAIFSVKNGKTERLCDDRLISAEALADALKEFDKPIYFFGDGYSIAKAAFPSAVETPADAILQNASSVAAAALKKYNHTQDKSIFTDITLSPAYLRASQAEREYNEKEKNK
ncbi:MAG: tRNA (adenosine(37)-N6)-threonylcarbamoyltransferase complex dimerization subunit type 1 TsaB [Clostridia bacterium]|nr:tRNA (adenosine(37)-N6)-threonylcarbamoyltransferase complex dimerization subunit type 1 TsaB [Clostridia bacterium]